MPDEPLTLEYAGLLSLHVYGDADDILFLSSERPPFAEVLKDAIGGKQVTARWWLTDRQCTKEEAIEDHVRQCMGLKSAPEDYAREATGRAVAEFRACYSEITGYLWTDEECRIGGHNLLGELSCSAGKWLILEIEVHGTEPERG